MRRFIRFSELKPEKAEDYIRLHAQPWPELLELITSCGIHNYSISIRGTTLYTYFEYTGSDYAADMARMEASPVMRKWWTFSKPCFLHRVGASSISLAPTYFIRHLSLTPLRRLSKSSLLRWASIWFFFS